MNARLSKSRRKRPVPKEWATPDAIQSFEVTSSSQPLYPGSSAIAVDASRELALVGGEGTAGVYSLADDRIVQTLTVGGSVTDASWAGTQPVVASSTGAVKVFDADGNESASFTSHAGSANSIALHPSGELLASVGVDKSFVFYDLPNSKPVTQIYTESGMTYSPNMRESMLTAT